MLSLTHRVELTEAPFLAKVDVESRHEQRGARRFLADRLDGLLIGQGSRFDVIIHNMSETGFLAEFASDLMEGDEVRLRLARLGFVDARVVWKRGHGYGCQFIRSVPEEVVHATIAARPSNIPMSVPVAPLERDAQRSAMPFVVLSAVMTGLTMVSVIAWLR